MAKVTCYEKDGKQAGEFDLPASLFECGINQTLVHEAVLTYLANRRKGTAATKERADVQGGGKKPYRQKGTGRARAGTTRSPIFRGGGTVFGPQPRSYRRKMTRRAKRGALTSSLTARAGAGDVAVIKGFDFGEPKTKNFAGILKNIGADDKRTLVVLDTPDIAVIKSTRNIPGVKTTLASMVSTYDVVWAEKILLTADAVAKMEEVFAS
jgi:large subunit ribosomal protein L4